jgi:hypothetical protein
MRVTTRLALLAAGIATPIALALPAANATTTACVIGDGGHCGGAVSHQSAPLEISVAVPVSQVRPGTLLVGRTPAFSWPDWARVHPPKTGCPLGATRISAPTVHRTGRSGQYQAPAMRTDRGAATRSEAVNVIDSGYRVYKNG